LLIKKCTSKDLGVGCPIMEGGEAGKVLELKPGDRSDGEGGEEDHEAA
jgi:hypothetical protein